MRGGGRWAVGGGRWRDMALAACIGISLASGADDATGIAARIVATRAAAAVSAGDAGLGTELRALADGLAAGRISLADAALVMQIAGAGRPATVAPSPAAAAAATREAIGILDGAPPRQPASTGVTPPAAALAAAGPLPTPSSSAAATPLIPAKNLSAIVLAVQADENNRPQLVMIGAGADQGVSLGQRFRLRRAGQDLVQATVVQIKPRMAACTLLANTWAEGVDRIVKENDQAVSPP